MNILWVLLISIWESMKNAYLFSSFFRFEKSTFNLRARTPKTHAAFHANENLWRQSYYQHLSLIFVLFVLNAEKSIAKSYDEFLCLWVRRLKLRELLFRCVRFVWNSIFEISKSCAMGAWNENRELSIWNLKLRIRIYETPNWTLNAILMTINVYLRSVSSRGSHARTLVQYVSHCADALGVVTLL